MLKLVLILSPFALDAFSYGEHIPPFFFFFSLF